MKISILGASGFIGTHVQVALQGKYKVQGISQRDHRWNEQLVSTDVVINLVGKAHDHKGTATLNDYMHTNVEIVKEQFSAFLTSNASLYLHISSIAAVEEIASKVPLVETAASQTQSHFGKSKRTAEEWLIEQQLPVGKKLIILRPPMVHGPGDKGNLGLLYKLISKGIPYPLASFNNKRSFISIDNFNYFIKQIIKGQDKLESGIYHIADDEPLATNTIISIIKEVENKKVPNLSLPKGFVRLMAKVGDVIPIPLNSLRLKKMTSDLVLSNQKIKNALGITELPLTAEEGMKKTIKSFKVNR